MPQKTGFELIAEVIACHEAKPVDLRNAYVPPGGESGVTISFTFDLGQHSKETVVQILERAGFTSDQIGPLLQFVGLKGDAARAALRAHYKCGGNIARGVFSADDAAKHHALLVEQYAGTWSKLYPSLWESVSPVQKASLCNAAHLAGSVVDRNTFEKLHAALIDQMVSTASELSGTSKSEAATHLVAHLEAKDRSAMPADVQEQLDKDLKKLKEMYGVNHGTSDQLPTGSKPPKQRQVTVLPRAPAEAYRTQPGDTVSGISQKFKVPMEQIVEKNGLRDPDRVYAGQKLEIPRGTGAVAVEAGVAAGVALAGEMVVNPEARTLSNVVIAGTTTVASLAAPEIVAGVAVAKGAYDVGKDACHGQTGKALNRLLLTVHQAGMMAGLSGAASGAAGSVVTALAISNPIGAAVVSGAFVGSAIFGLNQVYKPYHQALDEEDA